jgi:hypothetical protein
MNSMLNPCQPKLLFRRRRDDAGGRFDGRCAPRRDDLRVVGLGLRIRELRPSQADPEEQYE